MVGASLLFVALAGIFWGLSGGIGGILMASGWDPTVVAFYRGAVGLGFVLLWLLVRPGNSGLSDYRLWVWSSLAGLGVAGNFSFYFLSISESNVAVAATLMYCAPVFVYFLSFALGLERPSLFKLFAIVLVMLGVALLTSIHNLGAAEITLLGVAAGLMSGLSYALFIFSFKYAAPKGSPQAILSIALAVLAVVLLFPASIGQITQVLGSDDLLLFVTLGLIGAGFPFVFYLIGLRHTAPAIASIVAMVEPVTASLFGVFIMNEGLTGLQALGMGIILATVTALSIYSNTKHPGYIVWKPWRALKELLSRQPGAG